MKHRIQIGLLALSLLAVTGYFAACSTTPNRVAFQGEGTLHVTVLAGMGLWEVAVASGKTTVAQELKVKAAYEKVQAAAFVLCDAGKLLSAAGTNGIAASAGPVFEQATADFTSDKADFLTLLSGLGIKAP